MNPLLLPDSIEVAVGPQEDGPIEQGRCCHQRPLDEILRKLLELLIRSVDVAGWANRGFGQAAGYVWERGEPFYGTRVGQGWYQSGTRVARGCKVPFSVLRMLIQVRCKPGEWGD